MSVPIEEQVRDYVAMIDRLQGTIDVSEIVAGAPNRPRPLELVTAESSGTKEAVVLDTNSLAPRAARARVALAGVAAAVLLALLVGIIALVSRDDDPPAPAGPGPTATDQLDPIEAPATDLGFTGARLDPGRYSTHVLGTELTMTLDGEWDLVEARASMVALRRRSDASEAGDRWIFMARLGGWNSAEEAVDPSFRTTGSIDPADVDGWIDDNGIVVLERRSVQVDGIEALAIDVSVDPTIDGAPLDFPRDPFNGYNDSCTAGTAPCIWYRSIPAESERAAGPRPDPVMHAGQARRLWLVPLGDEAPMLLEAVADDGDRQWLDDVETTSIGSVELGAVVPAVAVG